MYSPSIRVIGVRHVGTASMDFGGKKNVGIAVGIIDGFVWGTGVMSLTYVVVLPKEEFTADGALTGPVANPTNRLWLISMVAIGILTQCSQHVFGMPNRQRQKTRSQLNVQRPIVVLFTWILELEYPCGG